MNIFIEYYSLLYWLKTYISVIYLPKDEFHWSYQLYSINKWMLRNLNDRRKVSHLAELNPENRGKLLWEYYTKTLWRKHFDIYA